MTTSSAERTIRRTAARPEENIMRKFTRPACALAVGALAVIFIGQSTNAHPTPCDFMTGGGFIITTASGEHEPAKANFGVGGGCKKGEPTWGHLQYIDHGNGLNVHWTAITAY